MVFICNYNNQVTIHAYSTVPLTPLTETVAWHTFWDGSQARFGDPTRVMQIHSEPEYRGLSHYELRALVDGSGLTDFILAFDDRTASSGAI